MVTVKVSNVSLAVTERELKEFFSFSGEIVHLEMQRSVLFTLYYNSLEIKLLCVLTKHWV